ncbi:riboflavin synthase [Geobacter benzoatilyticus]|jgi:riboflavin synthase|uniref:Riboflavin synthase n=1 Tax=Geobacter benzoatilyticus TaxID=2815309 RepID=A0ABX7Q128_9BACT|nr:riboflavin synthase [Geobacter benzoatilyticus]QSV45104.1 riboflavin synthase [Geobacter benzoatilyticus]
MFTGLIEDVGTVRRLEKQGMAGRITVATKLPLESIALGDSVAVNGACLTAVAKSGNELTFDASPETLARTTLGTLGIGTPVNLERALRLGDRLGGHIVTGHVDFIATVSERNDIAGNRVFVFRIPVEFSRYLVAKGSVTIDGISLTVNTVSDTGFSVNIIPHTGSMTTLSGINPGAQVNIETDILGKYIERLLSRGSIPREEGGLTLELLAKSGFL